MYKKCAVRNIAKIGRTSLNFYPLHYKSLCYRIIDCLNFPSVFRPGFHIERTDLNLFLEQWIPFDYGNQNSNDDRPTNSGRFHNWDGATKEWEVYNPSIKDPRKPGALSRSIARTLNIGTDFNCLTEDEIYKAFKRCQKGLPTILAYTDHDHRDMVSEIEDVVAKILYIHGEFKEHIDLKFTNAVDAMRLYRNIKEEKPIEFNVSLKNKMLDFCSYQYSGCLKHIIRKSERSHSLGLGRIASSSHFVPRTPS